MTFEYLEHTADIAIRLRAPDLPGILKAATLALRDIFAGPARAGRGEAVGVSLEAEDGEALLIDYLNELIFLFDTRRFLPASLDVTRLVSNGLTRLEGTVSGETFDPACHVLKTEVKAATFHAIRIRRCAGELEVDVVFDL